MIINRAFSLSVMSNCPLAFWVFMHFSGFWAPGKERKKICRGKSINFVGARESCKSFTISKDFGLIAFGDQVILSLFLQQSSKFGADCKVLGQ